jgi:hypothetical protein
MSLRQELRVVRVISLQVRFIDCLLGGPSEAAAACTFLLLGTILLMWLVQS